MNATPLRRIHQSRADWQEIGSQRISEQIEALVTIRIHPLC